MTPIRIAALAALLAAAPPAGAHGDKLDAYGCHKNRGGGGYHCHQGIYTGRSFASKEAMQKALEERKSGKKRRP